ncbi:MAG: hypothetical protein K2N90_12925 [Lachnospiraceae bacterium]|nr:hypothetical protein [Lachnospiraceae bacterium]
MELTYQGLRIVIPFEGAVGVEAFTLEASFNHHVCLEIILLADEAVIETVIHEIADGDSITVYGGMQEMPIFVGSITDAEMVNRKGLCCLTLKAVSHTAQWELVPESRSFQNPDASYGQVMQRVLENLPEAEIMDCVTEGAATGGFLLQYEESGWEFLVRLASCFGTFLVPDCRAEHGCAYFGIPDLGEECVLDGEDYEEMKDMDRYYRIGCVAGILPQEHMGWEITARCDLCLATKVRFKGISTIVTGIRYDTVNGELVRTYKLCRRKGYICVPKKNPHIFGMGIPATVKERSGNCVRVHFDIDKTYDNSPSLGLIKIL